MKQVFKGGNNARREAVAMNELCSLRHVIGRSNPKLFFVPAF